MLPDEAKAIGLLMLLVLCVPLVVIVVGLIVAALLGIWDALIDSVTGMTGSPEYIDSQAFEKRKGKVEWIVGLGGWVSVAFVLLLV